MYRRITYKTETYFDNHEVIGFCQGGSLTYITNNPETLEEKCNDDSWASDNDIFPIRADFLNSTDQKSETFTRWLKDGHSEGVTYFLRNNDGCRDILEVHWTTEPKVA